MWAIKIWGSTFNTIRLAGVNTLSLSSSQAIVCLLYAWQPILKNNCKNLSNLLCCNVVCFKLACFVWAALSIKQTFYLWQKVPRLSSKKDAGKLIHLLIWEKHKQDKVVTLWYLKGWYLCAVYCTFLKVWIIFYLLSVKLD